MAQMGHEAASLTSQVNAQVIQRQRGDCDLVWKLMRFHEEPETWQAPRRGAIGQIQRQARRRRSS